MIDFQTWEFFLDAKDSCLTKILFKFVPTKNVKFQDSTYFIPARYYGTDSTFLSNMLDVSHDFATTTNTTTHPTLNRLQRLIVGRK